MTFLFSQGRKFLSFLFGMHPKFVEDLHQTFKNQMPFSTKYGTCMQPTFPTCPEYLNTNPSPPPPPRALLEVYAEIYFRAWRLSSGPYLLQLEEHCLQDLMFCAVHAPRTGSGSLFHSLRKVGGCGLQMQVECGLSVC